MRTESFGAVEEGWSRKISYDYYYEQMRVVLDADPGPETVLRTCHQATMTFDQLLNVEGLKQWASKIMIVILRGWLNARR